MINSPLVSVIMPAYNAELFIEEAILSVIHQQHKNWELWIIDDASTDKTLSKIEAFLADPRIHLLKNKTNRGTAFSRNLGIKKSTGTYIAFLDADDLWFPEKLEQQLDFMKTHDQKMCFSSYLLLNEDGTSSQKMVEALPVLSYKKLQKSNYVGNLTGIYNVQVLGKIYSPELRKRQDWGLWLKVLEKTGTVKGILKPLAFYRIRRDSISRYKTGLVKYNFLIYKKLLGYNYLKSCFWMLIFLKEHFFVKKNQLKNFTDAK
ncbi:MAG: glycosyltransferase family 2 protein [Gillisia sp.]